MSEFDPETFEEEKYRDHFMQLQRAYKNAFDTMNDRYSSDLVHGIDQRVLNESEPVFEEGRFRVDLPENPRERLKGSGVIVDDETFEATLSRYVEEIEAELHRVFGVERPVDGAGGGDDEAGEYDGA